MEINKMITDIIENEEYKDLVCEQVKQTIEFLLDNNHEFSITANIEGMTFDPELPRDIKDQLAKISLFILSNYTYTTVQINENFLTFEAGYGSENFGSVAKVPLHSIFQIVVEESVLYINSVATVDKFNKNKAQNSMNIFKKNPNNKKFNK